jgi:hypothetical protein
MIDKERNWDTSYKVEVLPYTPLNYKVQQFPAVLSMDKGQPTYVMECVPELLPEWLTAAMHMVDLEPDKKIPRFGQRVADNYYFLARSAYAWDTD